jgi:GH43 family beta-xylosidase
MTIIFKACWLFIFASFMTSLSAQDLSFVVENAHEGPLDHSWILTGKVDPFDDVVLDCASFIHEFHFRSFAQPNSNFSWYLDVQECHDMENEILPLVFSGAAACVELQSSPYRVTITKC